MNVTFQTIDGQHYLCADQDKGGLVVADREQAYAWEEFEMVRGHEPDLWGFRSNSGKWIAAEEDGRLVARTEQPADWVPEGWGSFRLKVHSDGRVSFYTDHHKWVCAESGGGWKVVADRPAPDAWESFLPSHKFWITGGTGPTPIDPIPVGRVSVQDRFFSIGGQTYRPRWASALSILRRPQSEQEDLVAWFRSVGFNGIRVFAGALNWCGQTPELAQRHLPALLGICQQLNMMVEVVPITDSGVNGGYDVGAHTRAITDICKGFDNTLVELANEYWHPTQSESVHDPRNLLALRRSLASYIPMSLGAPGTDEVPQPGPFAEYVTLHLDRGRDKWNQVRRVRELETVSAEVGKPVINNEPIGADELDGSQTGRQRFNDPSFFLCLGALNRVFEVGGVFHSQFGLQAEMPGPVQTECAHAFIRGWSTVDTLDRVSFYNARWVGSPVVDADFDSGALVRAYSGVWGNRGVIVLVGLRGDPRLVVGNGWSVTHTIEEVSGCTVLGIAR